MSTFLESAFASAVSISNTSGLAGLAYWVNHHYRLLGTDEEVTKHDSMIEELKNEVDSMYVDGRTTIMSDEELEAMVHKLCPERF